jgi:hypothetical protein
MLLGLLDELEAAVSVLRGALSEDLEGPRTGISYDLLDDVDRLIPVYVEARNRYREEEDLQRDDLEVHQIPLSLRKEANVG